MRRVPVVTTVCVLAGLLLLAVVLAALLRMPDPTFRARVVHVDVATSGPVRSYPQ